MLARIVEGSADSGSVPSNAAQEEDIALDLLLSPVAQSMLCKTNRVHEVDAEGLVGARLGIGIVGRRGPVDARCQPERAGVRFVHASTGDD